MYSSQQDNDGGYDEEIQPSLTRGKEKLRINIAQVMEVLSDVCNGSGNGKLPNTELKRSKKKVRIVENGKTVTEDDILNSIKKSSFYNEIFKESEKIEVCLQASRRQGAGPGSLDLVIMLDQTGSMHALSSQWKLKIKSFVQEINELNKKSGISSFRFGDQLFLIPFVL